MIKYEDILLTEEMRNNIDTEGYKFIQSLNEEEKKGIVASACAKIFSMIVGKAEKINWNIIDPSKGNINKVYMIKTVKDVFDYLDQLVRINNIKNTDDIIQVKLLYANIEKYTNEFKVAYKQQNNYVILIYRTLVSQLIEATNLLSILYTEKYLHKDSNKGNDPLDEKVFAARRKSYDFVLNTVTEYNKMVASGGVGQMLSEFILSKKNENAIISIQEDIWHDLFKTAETIWGLIPHGIIAKFPPLFIAALSVAALFVFWKLIISIIRSLIYHWYAGKVTSRDNLEIMIKRIEIHKMAVLANNEYDEEKKRSIIENLNREIENYENKINEIDTMFGINTKKIENELNAEDKQLANAFNKSGFAEMDDLLL